METKRKPGRPATGRKKGPLHVTVDIKTISKLDKLKDRTKRTLSSIVDELLAAALKPKKKESA